MKIDLHMHSTHSDGKFSPKELVDIAIKKQIPAIAITDHDIISGSEKAIEYAKNKNIEIISGVEFGADDEDLKLFDIHIVGLFIDTKNKQIENLVNFNLNAREIQKKEIIKKLNKLGYDITFKELQIEAGSPNYGRPHIARILLKKYPLEFENMNQVFEKLLANPKTAYIRQKKKSIKETIDIIHSAKGIAILAHPGFYKNYKEIIKHFIKCGGNGIEVYYAYINSFPKQKADRIIQKMKKIAIENNLIISGGSDFHETKNHCEIGSFGITQKEFETMKNYLKTN